MFGPLEAETLRVVLLLDEAWDVPENGVGCLTLDAQQNSGGDAKRVLGGLLKPKISLAAGAH